MLTGHFSMPTAMLAPRRVAGMELTMLAIRVAMIFAMSTASAIPVPATMLGPMIARHIAMIPAMLPPRRIGRVQGPMLPPGIAMIGLVAAARNIVTVAGRSDRDLVIDVLHLALNPFGALGMRCFDTRSPFLAALRTRFIARLPNFLSTAVALLEITILRHRRHRHAGRKQGT